MGPRGCKQLFTWEDGRLAAPICQSKQIAANQGEHLAVIASKTNLIAHKYVACWLAT